MILSMTGFASQISNTSGGVLRLELRAVNHRYLELQFKLDDALRNFEPLLRERMSAALGRGKVDCRLTFTAETNTNAVAQPSARALQNLADAVKAAAQYFPQAQPVNLLEVLRTPGVLSLAEVDEAALEADLKALLEATLQELIATRQREGEKLKAIILARLAEVEAQVQVVKPLMPTIVSQYQAKLLQKLAEAQQSHDDERIRQEIVLYAQRIDVDEELSRLDAHISEVKRILQAGKAAGKRLDFLMQEMHREANTLGSKSAAIETTQASMQLKVLIEQMREQIQNIE